MARHRPTDHSSNGSARPTPSVKYTCPMHPQIVRDAPGSCSLCGMALEPMMPSADDGDNGALRDMSRRFWIAVTLTIPLLALAMGSMLF
ncbi:MAG: heavy metal-binding domain-containing protein, partial [Gemmatimonadaceae bacterium]